MTNPQESQIVSNISYWDGMAEAATSGTLTVPESVARACHRACADYISSLQISLKQARKLQHVEGMGTFPSGIQLARKFSLKAVGGPLSLEDVLLQHITVIEGMQAFFQKFFTAIEGQDNDNAALLAHPQR